MTVDQGPHNRAGTTRKFRTSRTARKVVAIAFAVMLAVPAAVLFTPAARQGGLSTWGALAVLGSLVVVAGVGIGAMSREAVIVRDGKVTIRNVRSRTIDVSEIRAVTAGLVSRYPDVPGVSVPEAELANGERIVMHALTLTSPESIAAYNEFRVLIGLPADARFEVDQ